MEIAVKKFYKAYIDFFSALFGYFSQIENPPTGQEEKFTKNDNTLTPSFDTTIDFIALFQDHYQDITDLGEYNSFRKSITADMIDGAGNKLITYSDSSLVYNFCRYICMLLYEKSNRSFKFDRQTADSLYFDMERHLLCDDLIYHDMCILRNFKSEVDVIELDSKNKIVKASDDEAQLLYRSREHLQLLPHYFIEDIYFIKTESKRKKKEPRINGKNRILFKDVRIALLLFKNCLVALRNRISTQAGGFDYMGGISFSGEIDQYPWLLGQTYTLSAKESEKFKKFYKVATKNLKKSFFRRAADRFVTAVYNHPDEERIIDFIIALECLYLPGIKIESSFRLSLRAARLIANATDADFEDVYNDLKLAINLRNHLVHGEDTSKVMKKIEQKYEKLHHLASKMQSYVRESMSFFFQNPKKRTDSFFKSLELGKDI